MPCFAAFCSLFYFLTLGDRGDMFEAPRESATALKD